MNGPWIRWIKVEHCQWKQVRLAEHGTRVLAMWPATTLAAQKTASPLFKVMSKRALYICRGPHKKRDLAGRAKDIPRHCIHAIICSHKPSSGLRFGIDRPGQLAKITVTWSQEGSKPAVFALHPLVTAVFPVFRRHWLVLESACSKLSGKCMWHHTYEILANSANSEGIQLDKRVSMEVKSQSAEWRPEALDKTPIKGPKEKIDWALHGSRSCRQDDLRCWQQQRRLFALPNWWPFGKTLGGRWFLAVSSLFRLHHLPHCRQRTGFASASTIHLWILRIGQELLPSWIIVHAEMHSLLKFFWGQACECACTIRLRKDIQSVGEELGYVQCLARMFGFFGMQPFLKFDQSKRTSLWF